MANFTVAFDSDHFEQACYDEIESMGADCPSSYFPAYIDYFRALAGRRSVSLLRIDTFVASGNILSSSLPEAQMLDEGFAESMALDYVVTESRWPLVHFTPPFTTWHGAFVMRSGSGMLQTDTLEVLPPDADRAHPDNCSRRHHNWNW